MHRGQIAGGHAYTRTIHTDASGREILALEYPRSRTRMVGRQPCRLLTDPRGPDATREMLRFFLEHSLPGKSSVSAFGDPERISLQCFAMLTIQMDWRKTSRESRRR